MALINKVNETIENLRNYKNKGFKIAIWGIGEGGRNVYQFCKNTNIDVDFFIDRSCENNSIEMYSKQVVAPQFVKDMKEKKGSNELFILIASMHYGEIKNQLISWGYEEGQEFMDALNLTISADNDIGETSLLDRLEFKLLTAKSPTGEEFLLFSEALIEERPDLAMEILGFASKFGIHLGWHYLLDLIWILSRLPLTPPARILDAGAGNGILQFILAIYGHKVVSADAFNRTPPAAVSKLITVKKSGSQKAIQTAYTVYHQQVDGKVTHDISPRAHISNGEIEFHCCNLEHLEHLETGEFDAVVSVSALEHNPPEKLPGIMAELRRVAKTKAPLLLTISVDSPTRFDEPSHSWLLDQAGVAETYGLAPGYTTNFQKIEAIRESLKKSEHLNRWLAVSYYGSGWNGMPWGRWNPTYLPAGLFLISGER